MPSRFPLTERQPSTAFAKTLFRTHFSSQTEIEKHLISDLIEETSGIPSLTPNKTSTPTRAGLQYRESLAYPVLHPMGAPNKFLLSWGPPHDEHRGRAKQDKAKFSLNVKVGQINGTTTEGQSLSLSFIVSDQCIKFVLNLGPPHAD